MGFPLLVTCPFSPAAFNILLFWHWKTWWLCVLGRSCVESCRGSLFPEFDCWPLYWGWGSFHGWYPEKCFLSCLLSPHPIQGYWWFADLASLYNPLFLGGFIHSFSFFFSFVWLSYFREPVFKFQDSSLSLVYSAVKTYNWVVKFW